MAASIKEIINLSRSGENAKMPAAKVALFSPANMMSESVTSSKLTDAADKSWAEGFAKDNDNIQVTWTDGAAKPQLTRAIAGNYAYDKETGVITISELQDASKYRFNLNGKIEIGPVKEELKAANPPVSISVRLGNMITEANPKGDTIIDFSDKTDGAKGTQIELAALIDWIGDKSGDTDGKLELPSGSDDAAVNKCKIEFKQFYFNITQKTFDFSVQTAEGTSFQIGSFTIKQAAIQFTNVPTKLPAKKETKLLEK
jgi:hypothetical protein